ncbi:unnamed protein product [Colias eurytheme]|nr:unnamed protein product [Colias eurytheme]
MGVARGRQGGAAAPPLAGGRAGELSEFYFTSLKRSIIIPYLDSLISALDQRFSNEHLPAFSLMSLHPNTMLSMTLSDFQENCKAFTNFYELAIEPEAELWYKLWKDKGIPNEELEKMDFTDTVKEANTFFPATKRAILILLAQPCTTANIERSFSTLRRVKTWLRSTMSENRLNGLCNEYESSSGKTVNAKSMKPPCTDKCRLSCSKKISEESRLQIFKSYWDLGCLQRQRDFLSSCITPLIPACRRIRTDAVRPRKANCGFDFIKDGKSIRVCKMFLLNTLGIAERTVRTVIDAKVSDVGIIPQDKRGKHGKQTKMDDEIKESVRLHINSISRVESHYLRANTSREFIDGGLTIAQLHRLYKEQRASANKEAATYDTYARIFNTEFNFFFFCPKKDQCDLCESYKNADEEGKKKVEQNFQEHLKQKSLSRKEKMSRRVHIILNMVRDNSRSIGENVQDVEKHLQIDNPMLEEPDVPLNESLDSNSIRDSQHSVSLSLLDDECLENRPNVVVPETDYDSDTSESKSSTSSSSDFSSDDSVKDPDFLMRQDLALSHSDWDNDCIQNVNFLTKSRLQQLSPQPGPSGLNKENEESGRSNLLADIYLDDVLMRQESETIDAQALVYQVLKQPFHIMWKT